MPPRQPNARKNNNWPPQPADPLNENVLYVEFWEAFQVIAQAVTNIQGNLQAAVPP